MAKKSNSPVVAALSQVLADTYVLQLKTQNYHWNVEGPTFASLHAMFEGQYDALAAAVDEVAERIRALGAHAPGTLKEFLDTTVIAEGKSGVSWKEMLEDLEASNRALSDSAAKCLKVAEKAGDEVTVDMMVGRMTEHDKAAWMLRAARS